MEERAMKVKKKRCQFCGRWYKPDPRTARFQKASENESCRKERQLQKNRNWAARYPDCHSYRATKIREWAARTRYWKRYRASHPQYVLKDNKRRVLTRKRLKVSAKHTAIRQITVDKLNSIRQNQPDLSAKHTAIDSRVDGLIDLLIWKELSAKQADIASGAASVP
jgi:hypothetical protein